MPDAAGRMLRGGLPRGLDILSRYWSCRGSMGIRGDWHERFNLFRSGESAAKMIKPTKTWVSSGLKIMCGITLGYFMLDFATEQGENAVSPTAAQCYARHKVATFAQMHHLQLLYGGNADTLHLRVFTANDYR